MSRDLSPLEVIHEEVKTSYATLHKAVEAYQNHTGNVSSRAAYKRDIYRAIVYMKAALIKLDAEVILD